MDNKYEGINLEQSLKVIFGRKLVFVFVAIVVAILFFVSLYIFYNDSSTEYVATFSYSYDELNEGTYYDGSTFDYSDLVSKSTLKEIKEDDDEYTDVDVTSMVASGDISIEKTTDDDTDEVTFTLTVQKSYFSSVTVASDFIDSIINYPIDTILETSQNSTNDSYLDLYDEAFYYSSKVTDMINQYDLLVTKYETLEEEFGDIAVDSDGDVLTDNYNALVAYFTDYDLSDYYTEAVNNGYVDDFTDNETTIIYKCNSLISQYLENEESIDELNDEIASIVDGNSSSSDLDSYNEALSTLITDNVTIKANLTSVLKMFLSNGYTVDSLETKFSKLVDEEIYSSDEITALYEETETSDLSTYQTLIATLEEKLQDFTDTYNDAEYYILENNISVTSSVSTSGNIGIVVSAASSIIVGLILGACVNIIIDQIDKNKKKGKSLDEDSETKIIK